MLQVATFKLPEEQKAANEFLATHKPDPNGGVSFNNDRLYVFFDDGTNPASYQIADLSDLLKSVRAARLQQEIALHTMGYELADLNMVKNKGKYEELSHATQQTKKAIDFQDAKEAYVLKRIEELRAAK